MGSCRGMLVGGAHRTLAWARGSTVTCGPVSPIGAFLQFRRIVGSGQCLADVPSCVRRTLTASRTSTPPQVPQSGPQHNVGGLAPCLTGGKPDPRNGGLHHWIAAA